MIREITCPSGQIVKIRKLVQRDFFPRGLVYLSLGSGKVSEELLSSYLKEHFDEVSQLEGRILALGIVEPRVTEEPTDTPDEIWQGEIGEPDRQFLLDAITEWSGLTPARAAEVEKFRRKLGDRSRSSRELLREDPVGAPRDDSG